ncbi:hypothetical protein KA005_24555, partial [bacterium]|nr:hypothetical protein [bacterium]
MTVTGSEAFPREHASLSDGTTTVKFIFTDGQGKKDERAFKADPYPRTALKTSQGESKYSDLEPPYFAIAQDDFTGGRGNEDFEADTSRYHDGYRIDTSTESGVVLGGMEAYATGVGFDVDQKLCSNSDGGSFEWNDLYDAMEYISVSFVASASYTTYECEVWIKRVGSPGSITVELWSDSASKPNAMLATKTLTAASITTDVISVFENFVWTGAGSNEDVTATTTYWVVIKSAGSDTATNHWKVGSDGDNSDGLKSVDGSTWVALNYAPYFRVTEVKTDQPCIFFDYKSATYFVTQPITGGNSELYINGDRGAADSNSGNKNFLNDSSKSWTTNEWIGAKALITKGPG